MDTNNPAKTNRLIFLSIVGIPLTIVLAASWLWFFVARGDLDLVSMLGTSNRGELVQPPRLLDEGELVGPDGAAFAYADLPRRWTFLVPGGKSCDAQCEDVLYLTRQIHQAMGKSMGRIQRFYVSDVEISDIDLEISVLSDKRPAPDNFEQYLVSEQRGLKAFTVQPGAHTQLFSEYSENQSSWYLVDPRGWIMMSYNSDVSYKDVISDLKFLLKNSSG